MASRRPAGTGSIHWRQGKNGPVAYLRWRDADGVPCKEAIGVVSQREAEDALRDRIAQSRRGRRRAAPLSFRQYAETWFRQGETKRAWTPATVAQYRTVHRRLVDHLGHHPLGAIRPRHVADLVEELTAAGYAPASVTRDLSVLSAIFETAVREELVESNPARRAERPKAQRRRWRLLTPEEVRRVERAFLEAQEGADEPERAFLGVARVLFLVLYTLGLRRHEALGLRWRDVSFLDARLQVVKSKSAAGERHVAIPRGLLDDLWQLRAATRFQGDDEYALANPRTGRPVNAETYAEAFRAALERAGITDHVRPFHDARHASLTLGAAAGEGLVALMARAGHANASTTKGYLHLAGVTFHDEAARLEQLLRGVGHTIGHTLASPGVTSEHLGSLNHAEDDPT